MRLAAAAIGVCLGLAGLFLAACHGAAAPGAAAVGPNRAGLVTLPCDGAHLKAYSDVYCRLGRNYVTPGALAVMLDIADRYAAIHPGGVIYYLDASGADGHRPFFPHLSHGDGREVDVTLFYRNMAGAALPKAPGPSGYGDFEPPRPGDKVMCAHQFAPSRQPDPAPDRPWRLDEARTRDLVKLAIADKRVKRVFLEPHLKVRLGLADENKIRFQGCQAARHDDHLHIDML